MAEANTNIKVNNQKDVQVCSTYWKFYTANLRWIVSDYDIFIKAKKEITSPAFYEFPMKNKERKWHIKIIPEPRTDLLMEMRLSTNTTEEIFIDSVITLEDSYGKVKQLGIFRDILFGEENIAWDIEPELFTKHLSFNEPASIKSFIINAHVRVYETTETIYKALSIKRFDSKNLRQDMSKFFRNDQSFCDVTITVKGKSFKAHKAILAARSEVFAGMLSNEMLEKINSSIEIKDLCSETVEKMLSFIYTDEVDDLDLKESAAELLDAAEQYNLQNLKEMCIAAMKANLAVENVLKTLQLADIYSISDLKKVALRFLIEHRHVIKSQDEFKSLIAERPHLMVEFIDIRDNIPENSDL